jgi:hypothetical protein
MKKTKVAVSDIDIWMFREFSRNSGEYVQTSLSVRGPKGRAIINLSAAEVGLLTKAGIEKL